MDKFNLKGISKNVKELYFGNVYLGECIRDVDGFFYVEFEKSRGLWSSNSLKKISEILDDLNKEWNEIINKEFNGN